VVFFFTAFFVVTISTGDRGQYQVPNLVNKFFIDVYNELSKNIKINIKKVNIPDKPRGVILSQSIASGKFVDKGKSNITLTINHGVYQLKVPGLTGQTLTFARSTVKNIPVDKNYYSLELGTITYMGDDGSEKTENESKKSLKKDTGDKKQIILKQWPPGGTYVNLDQKINLLVSGYPKEKKNKFSTIPKLIGMNLNFAREFLYKFLPNIKLNIESEPSLKAPTPIPISLQSESGTILEQSIEPGTEFEKVKDKILNLKIAFFPNSQKFEWGFERILYEIDDDGPYEFFIKTKGENLYLLEKGNYKSDQVLDLFTNRNRKIVLLIKKDGQIRDAISIKPDSIN
jgi:beta-lactam-binding protein with PASTA domain